MNLLFKRTQKTGRRVIFNLWAKAELTEEETNLIRKYKLDSAVIIDAIQPKLIRHTIIAGLVGFFGSAFVVAPILMAVTRSFNLPTHVTIALLGSLTVGFLYFQKKRETIYVKDLLHGRTFKCRSIIELARKEAHLEAITGYFRQVVESAKHWGGTETKPIEPLPPEEAKRFILSGPML